jgi:hypothetical protein
VTLARHAAAVVWYPIAPALACTSARLPLSRRNSTEGALSRGVELVFDREPLKRYSARLRRAVHASDSRFNRALPDARGGNHLAHEPGYSRDPGSPATLIASTL